MSHQTFFYPDVKEECVQHVGISLENEAFWRITIFIGYITGQHIDVVSNIKSAHGLL